MFNWRKNLYAVWFTQILSLMGFGFGMPFIPFFIQDLGVTDPAAVKLWTGILNAAPGAAMGIMAPVWGILADKVGKRAMLVRATIGGTIVMTGLGFSNSVYMVLAFRLCQGLMSGTVTSSAALVASGTPNNRLSYALGFISSSTFIGFSMGPAVGGLVAENFGYRISFFIGAGIAFIGLLLVIFLIEEPEKIQVPSGKIGAVKEANITQGKAGILISSFMSLFLLLFFMRLCRTLPNTFMPLYIQELRGTMEGTARVTGLLSGGIGLMSAVSGLTLSRLGDRMDKLRLLSILVGSGAAVSLVITIFPGFASFVVFLLITYFLIGGVEPLLMSITSGKVDSSKRGFLFGIQTTVGSVAWAVSPLLGSWISIKFSIGMIYLVFSILLFITCLISIGTVIRSRKTVSSIQ